MENVPAQAAGPSLESSAGSQNTDMQSSVHPVLTGFNRLSIVRQIAIIGGTALAIAITVMLVSLMWSDAPTYKPLITRMQDYNAQDIVEILQREGIKFEIDPTTQMLLVESGDLHKARMKLAAASLLSDKSVGLEVLDQDSALGTSQFIENARYRRGLEGELARTIASVRPVRSARVHLALPKQSVFVRDQRKPRASVFVEIYPGHTLSRDQVEAIVNLVASSVSDMDRSDVSVVDQYGVLLSKPEEKNVEFLAIKQLEYTNRVQASLSQSVNSILLPVLGEDNYKAEVAADIDFTIQEQTQELFNPDLIALRSEQLLNEENVDKINGGIPGALSNQPPSPATAPEEALGSGAGGAPVSRRSESTRNYEVDRTLSYQQQQVGRLRRLTVGVVVNDRAVTQPNGTVTYVPWSENDLQRLEILVKDAVGFNAARGDSVNVINSQFMGKPTLEIEEINFWTQEWFWDLIKQVLAGLFILVLIFGVIRPTIKSLANRGRDEATVLLDELEDAEAGLDDDKITLAGMDEYLLPGASESFERQLDALRGLIAEDPARVAQVVIRWVNEDNGR